MSAKMIERPVLFRASKGLFIREAMPGDDITKMVTRSRDDGSKVDEMHYNSLEGYIQDIYISTREYKGELNYYVNLIMMFEDGQKINLRMGMFNSCCLDILDRMENIKYEELVQLRSGINKEKERSFAWVIQFEGNVPKKYTKDTPHDKPSWEPIEANGKTIWDKTKQRVWWDKKIREMKRDIQFRAVTI